MRRSQFIGANGQLMRPNQSQPNGGGTGARTSTIGGSHRPTSATVSAQKARSGSSTAGGVAVQRRPTNILTESNSNAPLNTKATSNLSSSLLQKAGPTTTGVLRPQSAQHHGVRSSTTVSTGASSGGQNLKSSPRNFLDERNFVKPVTSSNTSATPTTSSSNTQKQAALTPTATSSTLTTSTKTASEEQMEREQRRALVDSFLFGGKKKQADVESPPSRSSVKTTTAPPSRTSVSGSTTASTSSVVDRTNAGSPKLSGTNSGLFHHRKVHMDFTSPEETAEKDPPSAQIEDRRNGSAGGDYITRAIEDRRGGGARGASTTTKEPTSRALVVPQPEAPQPEHKQPSAVVTRPTTTNSNKNAVVTVKRGEGTNKVSVSVKPTKATTTTSKPAVVALSGAVSGTGSLSQEEKDSLLGKVGLGTRKGRYHEHFPETGYYSCRKCQTPLFAAGSSSKVAAAGGYATFVKHFKPSLTTRVSLSGGERGSHSVMAFLGGAGAAAILQMHCSNCQSFVGQVTHSDSQLVQATAQEAEEQNKYSTFSRGSLRRDSKKVSTGSSTFGTKSSSFASMASVTKSSSSSSFDQTTTHSHQNSSSDLIQVNSLCISYVSGIVPNAYRGTEGVVDVTPEEADKDELRRAKQQDRINSWGLKKKGKKQRMVYLDAADRSDSEDDSDEDDSDYDDADSFDDEDWR